MYPQLNKPESQYPVMVPDNQMLSTEIREALLHYDTSPTLSDFLEIILRRKWLIIGVFFLFIVPAAVINFMIKPVFQATGSIEINPQSPKVTKFENIISNPIGMKTDEYYLTQLELLQSPALARRVIDRLDLDKKDGFNPELDKKNETKLIWRLANRIMDLKGTVMGMVMSLFQPATEHVKTAGVAAGSGEQGERREKSLAEIRFEKYMESLFKARLAVEIVPDTSIVQIKFDSTDPALSAQVVNGLIEEYISWQMDRRIEAAKAAKQQLEKQIKLARTDMEKSESEMNRYAREKGIVSLDGRLNLVYQQLEKINTALAEAEAERIQKGEFYKYTEGSDIASSPLVLQNTLIQSLRQQYIDLTGEYEKLRVFFKDDYPSVKNLKAKMIDIGKKIDAEQQRLLNSFKNDYLAAEKKEKALLTTAEEKKALALQLNDYASRYKVLEREVEINKQIFQSLLERSKEIDANVGTDLGNIKIVDLASMPLRPVKPKMLRNLFLAAALGLMAGCGLAFFREYMDRTIRRIDEISDRHMIPILGVLPLVSKEEAKRLDTLVRVSPASLFSEAVRAAKASVQLACARQREDGVKSFLVTGTTAGEGKTTIASNLAQAYAATGAKVLIMDADLRRPRLDWVFARQSGNGHHGLSHFLNGVCSVEQIIQETDVPNLYYIPSGPASSRLAELLASSNMKKLLSYLSENFDRVILDSPPFGVFADVLLLAGQVDAVILVTALGRTHREDVRIFRSKIVEARGHLLGSIVNKLDLNRYNGSYYQKHYRSYYSRRYDHGENLPVKQDF
ncbi:MAG: polysaccharide biosynthesis tyrosine autokinase [Deltaproteobacteria bacterium]|nr:polysaccharide biosynthesis tyrosine autokinase [Deltaproteobacteria bacterium]